MGRDKAFLKTDGARLVDGEGRAVILRGVGVGGWMNMENFISGYACNEDAQRRALREVLGPELADLFFERFLEHFFSADDAGYIASVGMNHVRIPVNYRHFEDDAEPMVIKESGFGHLDRAIEFCGAKGIYTIIDLHALPGFQNQDWHSDNPTHTAFFWQHRHFQDRVVNLWEEFARRYCDNPWVAGYNLINEPADPAGVAVRAFYDRLMDAVRAIDPDHVIFLDANRYSIDTSIFDPSWPGVVYAVHDYPAPGQVTAGPYPGVSGGKHYDRDVLERSLLPRISFMLEHGLPIWVGEFGPIYTGDPEKDAMRCRLLRDQLEIYEKYSAHWSIWTYKDVGVMGMTTVRSDSPYLARIRPFMEKQDRLGAGGWKTLDAEIRHIMEPLEKLFEKEFPDYDPFPFGAGWNIRRLVRSILLSEPLLLEWAGLLRGATAQEIEEMAASFRFDKCQIRTGLAEILRAVCNKD